MPPANLKQKSPEEQNRQDDGDGDDDYFYETHELILKLTPAASRLLSEGCILSAHCEKCQRFGQKWPAARLNLPV